MLRVLTLNSQEVSRLRRWRQIATDLTGFFFWVNYKLVANLKLPRAGTARSKACGEAKASAKQEAPPSIRWSSSRQMIKQNSKNLLLVVFSAILLVFAFPNFELWFLAWMGLVPFFWAIADAPRRKAFILGWIWGILFFFGSCWWLAHALIHYGDIPSPIAYFLIFLASAIVGIFPAIFAFFLSQLFGRFGIKAVLSTPFLWTSLEFARFWITGNNWNAIAYSQAFNLKIVQLASFGSIYLIGFLIVAFNAFLFLQLKLILEKKAKPTDWLAFVAVLLVLSAFFVVNQNSPEKPKEEAGKIVVVQLNVPGRGLNEEKWLALREKHIRMAENALKSSNKDTSASEDSELDIESVLKSEDTLKTESETASKLEDKIGSKRKIPTLVVFPESPMNFSYGSDPELRKVFADFTKRNHVSLLFNSAEPNSAKGNYFNSAIMIDEKGEKRGQYDKIFLVPFGEYAPVPKAIEEFVPTVVGHFEKGREYDIFFFGDIKFGIMICYESHFPNLSREYAKMGADILIEMTNDGYLGKTPVLRQHLANAIFRAVETGRPVIRATNVGITAYIDEKGKIFDEAESYAEAVRVWSIGKSDGFQTFYVKYGDWLAILCVIFTLIFVAYGFSRA
jgi:apolipoprotein N-acyltransferase